MKEECVDDSVVIGFGKCTNILLMVLEKWD